MSGPARGTQPLGLPRSQARIVIREHLSVTDSHGLEEPLLSQRQRDEVPKFDQLRLGEMLRLEDWSRPAGESPVRVSAGAPGSRPRFVVERRRAERGVESLFGGSKRAGWNCSLVESA
jgi:hypothetical protein